MAKTHGYIIQVRKAARETLVTNKKQDNLFGDKDKAAILLQLQYAVPEERTMTCTRAGAGKPVTLPRGRSPGGPPETDVDTAELWGISVGGAVGRAGPANASMWTEPVAAEHRGIFTFDAATGVYPSYPDHVKLWGISLGEASEGQGSGGPDTATGNTNARTVDHHDESDEQERKEAGNVRCSIDNIRWKAKKE